MIGILTGLTAEARLAAPLGTARAGGGWPEGAARATEALIAEGATALISFGLAGGLNPALAPGTLIIPGTIRTARTDYPTCPALTQALGGPRHTLLAAEDLAITAADKTRLHAETMADAVDLESGAMAALAQARGIPFAALRAICDPASATLPPAALIALNAQGAITLHRVIGSVLRHPGQLPALLRLGQDANAARAHLARHIRRLAWPPALQPASSSL